MHDEAEKIRKSYKEKYLDPLTYRPRKTTVHKPKPKKKLPVFPNTPTAKIELGDIGIDNKMFPALHKERAYIDDPIGDMGNKQF